MVFIVLEKAFDKVNWQHLFKSLKATGIDWRGRRFILSLFIEQKTELDVNGTKEETIIGQKIKQGCPLSPYLFITFIEINETKP